MVVAGNVLDFSRDFFHVERARPKGGSFGKGVKDFALGLVHTVRNTGDSATEGHQHKDLELLIDEIGKSHVTLGDEGFVGDLAQQRFRLCVRRSRSRLDEILAHPSLTPVSILDRVVESKSHELGVALSIKNVTDLLRVVRVQLFLSGLVRAETLHVLYHPPLDIFGIARPPSVLGIRKEELDLCVLSGALGRDHHRRGERLDVGSSIMSLESEKFGPASVQKEN